MIESVSCYMKRILIELFLEFAKIGLFTFGGGCRIIYVIEHNCVERKKWITHEEMMNVTILAESTPGPIAVNCATFVGNRQAGMWGAVAATVGMILPSFVIIYCISMFLQNFLELTVVANAFRGIQIAVGLLILEASLNMMKKMKKGGVGWGLLAGAAVLMLLSNLFSWGISSITILLLGALAGLMVHAIQIRKNGEVPKGR